MNSVFLGDMSFGYLYVYTSIFSAFGFPINFRQKLSVWEMRAQFLNENLTNLFMKKMSEEKYKFGTPVKERLKRKVVLNSKVYHECLDAFLERDDKAWKLNQVAFKDETGRYPKKGSIMRALKRIMKKAPKYSHIVVFSQQGEIYLEKRDKFPIKRRT